MVEGGPFQQDVARTGGVALTTDGPPVVSMRRRRRIFADTNAVVAWSANLQTQV